MRMLTSVVLWKIIMNIYIYMSGSQSKTKKLKICIVFPVRLLNWKPGFGKGMLYYDVMDLSQHWFSWWLVAPWHQAIDWTNIDIWSTGYSEMHFNEILIAIIKISFQKMGLNVSSARYQPFCSGPNVLILKYLLWENNTQCQCTVSSEDSCCDKTHIFARFVKYIFQKLRFFI